MKLSRLYRQQTLRTRLILAFILTVLIPLVGTSLYGNWVTSRILQSRAAEAAQADLHLRRLQMEDTLRGVEENLIFLSQMNSMVALLNGRSPENLARTQIDFADFVSTHSDVFQARYLDETGLEVMRIDAGTNGLTLVPPDQLQNKADRYYFTQTMALPSGDVFISPIDLNREFGQIQEPQTPTLRYSTPVFATDGSRAGMVILNLYAELLLQFAQGETLTLTDDAGYFLLHPNADFEWGSPADLDTGINDKVVFPDAWQDIHQANQGIVLPMPENGWQAAWEFLNPFFSSEDGRRVLVYETIQGGGNQWRLINNLSRATFFASVSDFRVTAVLIVIWAMLLAAGIAVLFARQITQPVFYDAPGEAQPDWWAIAQFAQKMGFEGFDWEDDNAVFEEAARFIRGGHRDYNVLVWRAKQLGMRGHELLRTLGTQGIQTPIRWVNGEMVGTERLHDSTLELAAPEGPTMHHKWLTHFKTQSGKAVLNKSPWELFSDFYERITPDRSKGEMWLTSGRINEIWQSGADDVRKPFMFNRWPDTWVEIHPDDAAEFGIESGDEVRMWNDDILVQHGGWVHVKGDDMSFTSLMEQGLIHTGSADVRAVAIVSEDIKPGVLFTNFLHQSSPSNALVHRVPDPITNAYRFKLGKAFIEKMGESPFKNSFEAMTFKERTTKPQLR